MHRAQRRPLVVITSNAEKELPDPFLRRCIFHYIEFPAPELMDAIVHVHHPDIEANLLREAINAFYALREIDDFRKKPSTSELIDWIRALVLGGANPKSITKEFPFISTLLKKEQDHEHFQKRYLNRVESRFFAQQR